MNEEREKLITKGFGFLKPNEKREVKRLLRKAGVSFREVRTNEGDEIVLLKVTVSGVLPKIVKFLAGVGVDIIDWFQR